MKARLGRTYKLRHPSKGDCICKITFIGKIATYGIILDYQGWSDEVAGDEVRIGIKSRILSEVDPKTKLKEPYKAILTP